jgi:hypothetical protein
MEIEQKQIDFLTTRFITIHEYIQDLEQDSYKKRLLDIQRNLVRFVMRKPLIAYKYCDPNYLYRYDYFDFVFELFDGDIEYDLSIMSKDYPYGYFLTLEGFDDFHLYDILLDFYGCLDSNL